MRIKIFLYIILYTFLSACVGPDYTSLPQSIEDAKEDNLLFDIYLADKKKVFINEKEYTINEAFTATKFISTKEKKVNQNVFVFIVKLKNSKTGKGFEYDCDYNWNEYINFNSEKGGIHDSNLGISYRDFKISSKLDTIKIGFINNQGFEEIVTFTKKIEPKTF